MTTLLIVQIEHIDAVRNIDEILSVPELTERLSTHDLLPPGVVGQLIILTCKRQRKSVDGDLAHGLAGIHLLRPDDAVTNLQRDRSCHRSSHGSDIMFLGDCVVTCVPSATHSAKEHGFNENHFAQQCYFGTTY